MNIIFGDSVKNIPEHYTILELDTFRVADTSEIITAYCLVEKLALDEFATLDANKKIHADLINAYRNQQWEYCEQAIQGLMGRWNSEVDTFYTDLLHRVMHHQEHGVSDNWDATIIKNSN